jgi:hypothetical protein
MTLEEIIGKYYALTSVDLMTELGPTETNLLRPTGAVELSNETSSSNDRTTKHDRTILQISVVSNNH